MGLATGSSRSTATAGCGRRRGRELELGWPRPSGVPDHGYVVRRRDLDRDGRRERRRRGGHPPGGPRGPPADGRSWFRAGTAVSTKGGNGASARRCRAEFTIVADGANSRFGRALGTCRASEWPYGTTIRTYWESPATTIPGSSRRSTSRTATVSRCPGTGIFPVGDGTVNIGVGLLSTFRDFKSVNTTHLLDAYAAPDRRAVADRSRLGLSADRPAGASPWADGRAQGRDPRTSWSATRRRRQPVQRRGHRLRLRDGRMAADMIHEALVGGDPPRSRATPRRSTPSTASTSRSPGSSPG